MGFRRQGLSPCLWLLVPTFSLRIPPPPLAGTASLAYECSSTAHFCRSKNKPAISVSRLAPLNLWRKISRRVSCYALFKGWLLLSQPPRCLRNSTTFYTEREFRDLNWRSGLFPSCTMELSPHVLTPEIKRRAFGVWLVCRACALTDHPVALPHVEYDSGLAQKLFRREPAISKFD